MITRTADELVFLAAIREQSDDDTARLAYADYLDENGAVSVECQKCKRPDDAKNWVPGHIPCPYSNPYWQPCSNCDATTFVLDTSNRDRAAFIRLQIEIASWGNVSFEVAAKASRILKRYRNGAPIQLKGTTPAIKLAREQIIREKYEADWRRGPKCDACENGRVITVDSENGHQWSVLCLDCRGTGDAGGLMIRDSNFSAEIYLHKVNYVRGMKRVECRAEEVWERPEVPCPTCKGKSDWAKCDVPDGTPGCGACGNHGVVDGEWRPTAWALAACRAHPDVVELWVSDREPTQSRDGVRLYDEFRWFVVDPSGVGFQTGSDIPRPVFDLMTGGKTNNNHGDGAFWLRYYSTADLARTALARAAVLWVHSHLKPGSNSS